MERFDKNENGNDGFIEIYIGIMAYNEEAIIAKNLESIISQQSNLVKIKKIYVVSSGSTDGTNEIVKEFALKDNRIELIVEPKRLGKAHAINTFLDRLDENSVAVLVSSDIILKDRNCLHYLCEPFLDSSVGMTSCRPIPINSQDSLLAKAVFVLWELRHEISLISAKTGEMVAFRKVFDKMPESVLVDEAYIEYVIERASLKIVYTDKAIVLNKGPETFSDLIKQRKRIYIGHKLLERTLGYKGSSFDLSLVLRKTLRFLRAKPSYFLPVCVLFACELWARLLGRWDLMFDRYNKEGLWDIVSTTKRM